MVCLDLSMDVHHTDRLGAVETFIIGAALSATSLGKSSFRLLDISALSFS